MKYHTSFYESNKHPAFRKCGGIQMKFELIIRSRVYWPLVLMQEYCPYCSHVDMIE